MLKSMSRRGRRWLLWACVAVAGLSVAILFLSSPSSGPKHANLYNDLGGIAWGVEHGDLVVYVVDCFGGEPRSASIRVGDTDEIDDSGDGRLVARSLRVADRTGNVTKFEMAFFTGSTTVRDLEDAPSVIVDVPDMGAAFMDDDEQVPDGFVNAGGWVATPEEFIDDVHKIPGC